MDNHRLTLKFEGHPREGGNVRLSDFISCLDFVKRAIGRFDRSMSETGSSTFYYRIVGLKLSSPAEVVVEPLQRSHKKQMNLEAASKTMNFWGKIDRGEMEGIQGPVELALIEDAKKLSSRIKKNMASMKMSSNGTELNITPEFNAKIEMVLAPKETYPGIVRGFLSYFDGHGDKQEFRVYSDIPPEMVKCYFPPELMDRAVQGLRQHVEVRGDLSCKAIAKFPDEIAVNHIKIFPKDEELPTLNDLKGMIPGLTGNLSIEDYLRKIRNAEEN